MFNYKGATAAVGLSDIHSKISCVCILSVSRIGGKSIGGVDK